MCMCVCMCVCDGKGGGADGGGVMVCLTLWRPHASSDDETHLRSSAFSLEEVSL